MCSYLSKPFSETVKDTASQLPTLGSGCLQKLIPTACKLISRGREDGAEGSFGNAAWWSVANCTSIPAPHTCMKKGLTLLATLLKPR